MKKERKTPKVVTLKHPLKDIQKELQEVQRLQKIIDDKLQNVYMSIGHMIAVISPQQIEIDAEPMEKHEK